MKILITTDWYTPTVNGVVISILNLRHELIARGHDVRVLTLSQTSRSFKRDGVTYIGSVGAGNIYPGARIKTALFGGFVQDILNWQPDMIHSQCEFSTFFIACKIAKKLGIPIIHTYHTVYEDYTHYFSPSKKWGRFLVASLSRWVTGATACVIAPTEKVKNILNSYGIQQDIHVIPTGIDLNRFKQSPAPERQRAIRKQLGIPEENQILLYVGRLAKEKNLEELLQYHANCAIENLTFLIVGDGPYRDTLERTTWALGICDSVRFSGMIPPKEIGDYYHIGDLFVSGSVSETQGLTYIEALACGLPALCRRDECLDGVVIDGFNGWQYENEQDYKSKLTDFLSRKEVRMRMKENAAGLAQRKFSSEVFAKKAERVYLNMLDKWVTKKKVPCPEVTSCR
ncbi:glycosyltransferase family 4 protein [Bacillaceae bacterium Marseille-Q3522]|nr:glycosyltransferase family 4 protein [Bacillaceae bacterium Marseille-Q3522]